VDRGSFWGSGAPRVCALGFSPPTTGLLAFVPGFRGRGPYRGGGGGGGVGGGGGGGGGAPLKKKTNRPATRGRNGGPVPQTGLPAHDLQAGRPTGGVFPGNCQGPSKGRKRSVQAKGAQEWAHAQNPPTVAQVRGGGGAGAVGLQPRIDRAGLLGRGGPRGGGQAPGPRPKGRLIEGGRDHARKAIGPRGWGGGAQRAGHGASRSRKKRGRVENRGPRAGVERRTANGRPGASRAEIKKKAGALGGRWRRNSIFCFGWPP